MSHALQEHFRRLASAYPEIRLQDMLFFDNERWNIGEVSKLGVVSIHCPDGMTREIWEEGLVTFREKAAALQK